MKYAVGPWKFMKNGFMTSRDESICVGTFHNDKTALAQGIDSRALVAHAPVMFELLTKWGSAEGMGAPAALYGQTVQLLNDIRNAKGVS